MAYVGETGFRGTSVWLSSSHVCCLAHTLAVPTLSLSSIPSKEKKLVGFRERKNAENASQKATLQRNQLFLLVCNKQSSLVSPTSIRRRTLDYLSSISSSCAIQAHRLHVGRCLGNTLLVNADRSEKKKGSVNLTKLQLSVCCNFIQL